MPITYQDGANARTPSSIYYQDGATLRTIQEVWIGDGGVNRQVFGAASVNITNRTISATHAGVGSAIATYQLASSGQASGSTSSGGTGGGTYSGEWLTSGSSASCEVRATKSSGTDPGGSALGSWLALSSTRSWTLSRATVGSVTCDLLIEIRVGGVVVDSATITLTASKSS